MLARMASKKQPARKPVFAKDEMSTGKTSTLMKRAQAALAPLPSGSYAKLTVDPPRPSVSNDPVRDEIHYRERQVTAQNSALKKERPVPVAEDLQAKQLKQQAEANLHDDYGDEGGDFSDEFDDEEDTVPGID